MRWTVAFACCALNLVFTAAPVHADAPTPDEAGVYTFQRGMAGQRAAMEHLEVRAEALDVGQTTADSAHADQAEDVMRAVFDTLINRGGCETLAPSPAQPVFDGFCSSDLALALCVDGPDDPETFGRDRYCFGFINQRPGRAQGVLEVMGVEIAETGDAAQVQAALVWAERRSPVKAGYFNFDLARQDNGWAVVTGANIDTGQALAR